MMQLNAYLSFDGRCEDAFKFYERAFGGKIVARITYAETLMKDQMPANWHLKIAHVRLVAGDAVLMGGDPPPQQYKAPQGITVTLGPDDRAEAERAFAMLSEGGNVTMPIAETFWARRFGMVVDRFGIPWMINCEKPAG